MDKIIKINLKKVLSIILISIFIYIFQGFVVYSGDLMVVSPNSARLDLSRLKGYQKIRYRAGADAGGYYELHSYTDPVTEFKIALVVQSDDRTGILLTGPSDYHRLLSTWERWKIADFQLADITERPHPIGNGIYGEIHPPSRTTSCMFAILGLAPDAQPTKDRYRDVVHGYYCLPKGVMDMEQFIGYVEQIRVRSPW